MSGIGWRVAGGGRWAAGGAGAGAGGGGRGAGGGYQVPGVAGSVGPTVPNAAEAHPRFGAAATRHLTPGTQLHAKPLPHKR